MKRYDLVNTAGTHFCSFDNEEDLIVALLDRLNSAVSSMEYGVNLVEISETVKEIRSWTT